MPKRLRDLHAAGVSDAELPFIRRRMHLAVGGDVVRKRALDILASGHWGRCTAHTAPFLPHCRGQTFLQAVSRLPDVREIWGEEGVGAEDLEKAAQVGPLWVRSW